MWRALTQPSRHRRSRTREKHLQRFLFGQSEMSLTHHLQAYTLFLTLFWAHLSSCSSKQKKDKSNLELPQKLLSAVFSKSKKAEKSQKAVILQAFHSTNEVRKFLHNLLMTSDDGILSHLSATANSITAEEWFKIGQCHHQ